MSNTLTGLERFAALIPETMLDVPGHAFYTGEEGFTGNRPLYLLGLNPGGDGSETVRQQFQNLKAARRAYSAYVTHTWKPAARIDHNVLHLLRKLSLKPTEVPASCLVFSRTHAESDIAKEFGRLARLCWPFHEAVIRTLGVQVVVCFGKSTGEFVRRQYGAHHEIDHFVERNNRGWRSTTHLSSGGLKVVTVTHPSRADWRNPLADVSPLVARALEDGQNPRRFTSTVNHVASPVGSRSCPPVASIGSSAVTFQTTRGK
ncbi:hypothetical protein [Tessaracoccus massiliensis]|uniref:hypothetical protein n=1 Tax=Tessaracoccus massiliensis TaxID=1522311 RepID=UPI00059071B4|nr:hypothetical protein [Tessaracoccus massiliensis]